jgi:glyoxylase-like metal-dependent hydrolase (beta-lactamase superfamily II)
VLIDSRRVIGREAILRRFPDATEAEYEQAFAEMGFSIDEAEDSFNILLARLPSATVLVDSGEGGKPYGGDLLKSMTQAAITPHEIDLIIISHSHGDHIQGLLYDRTAPVFPKASYVMSSE